MSPGMLPLIAYLLLPFIAALAPVSPGSSSWLNKGSLATIARILLLLALARGMVLIGGTVTVKFALVQGYPLDIVLSMNPYRYGFLLVAEFCFLLAHWLCPPSGASAGMVRVLVGMAQGICSLVALADNTAATGALLLLAGTVFFYLLRFAGAETDDPEERNTISIRTHVLFYLLGLLMIAWGITEFSAGSLLFGRGTESRLGVAFWLALVILAVPLPPWSSWFSRALEVLPEGVSLTLVIFVCTVALKLASLFGVSYPDLSWKLKVLLYVLGIMGCCLSIVSLLGAPTRRRMLGSLPGFFLSMVLVSIGVSRSGLVLSAYFACLFVPVLTGLVLSVSAAKMRGNLQRVFVGLLFVLVIGLPGTPVYQLFSGVGARSLDLGLAYTIVFGLLWFFYFNANVHICRRLFLDPEGMESGEPRVRLEGAPGLFTGYGIFLMVLVIVVAQVAGRIL